MRQAFRAVREEFDDHLQAINDNTEEILENRAMILEIQERLCKLSDRISEIGLRLDDADRYAPIDLSLREQEMFIVLYTASQPVTYAEFAKRLTYPVSLIQELAFGLIQKGIPVVKQRSEMGELRLSLDIEFSERQTKHNIVRIDENLSRQLSRELQTSLF